MVANVSLLFQSAIKNFFVVLFSLLCCEVGGSTAAKGQNPEAGEQKAAAEDRSCH